MSPSPSIASRRPFGIACRFGSLELYASSFLELSAILRLHLLMTTSNLNANLNLVMQVKPVDVDAHQSDDVVLRQITQLLSPLAVAARSPCYPHPLLLPTSVQLRLECVSFYLLVCFHAMLPSLCCLALFYLSRLHYLLYLISLYDPRLDVVMVVVCATTYLHQNYDYVLCLNVY